MQDKKVTKITTKSHPIKKANNIATKKGEYRRNSSLHNEQLRTVLCAIVANRTETELGGVGQESFQLFFGTLLVPLFSRPLVRCPLCHFSLSDLLFVVHYSYIEIKGKYSPLTRTRLDLSWFKNLVSEKNSGCGWAPCRHKRDGRSLGSARTWIPLTLLDRSTSRSRGKQFVRFFCQHKYSFFWVIFVICSIILCFARQYLIICFHLSIDTDRYDFFVRNLFLCEIYKYANRHQKYDVCIPKMKTMFLRFA